MIFSRKNPEKQKKKGKKVESPRGDRTLATLARPPDHTITHLATPTPSGKVEVFSGLSILSPDVLVSSNAEFMYVCSPMFMPSPQKIR